MKNSKHEAPNTKQIQNLKFKFSKCLEFRISNFGFTLIEVLLTIGILGALLAIVLPVSWDFYTRYQFDSEASTLISILESARNSSMVNLRESPHGVYIASDKFIMFQGQSYALRDTSRDRDFPRNTGVAVSGPSEIVFAALSGATTVSTFTLTGGQRTATVSVNSEGAINF